MPAPSSRWMSTAKYWMPSPGIAHRSYFDRDSIRFLNGIGRTVCARWREPDEGIWEGRAGRFHHTHLESLCWVALDRLIWLHEHPPPDRRRTFPHERDAIRAEIEAHGLQRADRQLHAGLRWRSGRRQSADTAPLWLCRGDRSAYGLDTGLHYEQLGRNGLIYRYTDETDDGLPKGEGAFGICSFWAVECQAEGGDLAGASGRFTHLLGYANDVGLFAEEIDPANGMALGNFPQAFTHIGLINAALALSGDRADPRKKGS